MIAQLLSKVDYIHKKDAHNYLLNVLLERRLEILKHEGLPLNIVQIGANDGTSCEDSVYPFIKQHAQDIQAYLIEPMQDAYASLQQVYAPFNKVKTINKAVHSNQKTAVLHRLNESFSPGASGIASFNSQHKENFSFTKSDYITEQVNCLSFHELIDMYQIQAIDWLQMDTEGYDIELIKAFPFKKIQPRIIRFEYMYGKNIIEPEKLKEGLSILNQHHYFISIEDQDVIAYHFDTLYESKSVYQKELPEKLNLTMSEQESKMHQQLVSIYDIASFIYQVDHINFFQQVEKWFLKLIELNGKQKIYPLNFFKTNLANVFFQYCFFGSKFGSKINKLYSNSSLAIWATVSRKQKAEFKLRCLFRIKR